MLKLTSTKLLTTGLLLLALTNSVRSDPVSDFYSGKTVNIVNVGAPGGGYFIYGQLAADFLGKYIPGHPTVIVQSMPGAGGIRAANYLANVAPKNGATLGVLIDMAAVTQMIQPRETQYDLSKFSVIGSFVTDNTVLMVRSDSGVRNVNDLKVKPVIIGASAKGSQAYIYPALLNSILGAKLKIVTGYKGASDASLAMERNEVQAQSATWTSWKARRSDWIEQKRIIPLVQIGLTKERDLQDVPLMSELATMEEDRQVLEFMSSASQLGRVLYAPPGVPSDRVAALKRAFDTMVKDPEFLAAAAKLKMIIDPTRSEDVEAIIQRAVSYPPAVVKRAGIAAGVESP